MRPNLLILFKVQKKSLVTAMVNSHRDYTLISSLNLKLLPSKVINLARRFKLALQYL
jgi:hypothetical protein